MSVYVCGVEELHWRCEVEKENSDGEEEEKKREGGIHLNQ